MRTYSNDTLLKTLKREPTSYTPIWIMRQAGRYLPEYRQLRARAGSFLKLCKTPEWACEATLQPLSRYPLDAAILFSDILTVPDAMGLGLNFVEGEGPHFQTSITTLAQVQGLPIPTEEHLAYVMSAIRLIKAELANKVPLIGFAGSPFTLAAYMVEGGASKNFQRIKTMINEGQSILLPLLEKLSIAVSTYLNAQIKAGVDIVMIFDSWGGLLDDTHYKTLSLHYIELILKNLKPGHDGQAIPSIVFTRGASTRITQLHSLSSTALGIDQETSLSNAKDALSHKFVLQGNFAPELLKNSDAIIKQKVSDILNTMQGKPHIFNLGHGITPDIDPDKLALLINEVHEQSKKLRQL